MRVAVLPGHGDDSRTLARWALRIARALEAELRILWPAGSDDAASLRIEADQDVPPDAPAALADLVDELRRPSGDELDGGSPAPPPAGSEVPPALPLPPVDVRGLADDEPATVLGHLRDEPIDVVVVGKRRAKGAGPTLARRLFAAAHPTLVVLRTPPDGTAACRRIAVATAGGPSARAALRLADRLARAEGAALDVLHVLPEAEADGEELGRRLLDDALEDAGLGDEPRIERRVVQADDLARGITAGLVGEHDLLLLGASHQGGLRRLMFGTVPDRFLDSDRGLAIGVVREAWGPGDRLRAAVGRWLDLRIPQLRREERTALAARLESGAVWSFDFMALMALSTAIAAFGLLQDSGAVVIGAMLVAPLMTPILATGLALLQGNPPLLRHAVRSLVRGYLLALAIGFGAGLAFPIPRPTGELLARGGPTLLDMGVAFLSGLAAAYCLGRPGLLAALPGVAIAAALVPPIATTGIVLALGRPDIAAGSSLLFGTNVVAIVVGAAIALYAGGIRGSSQSRAVWPRAAFLALVLALGWLAVPLTRSSLRALGDGGGVGAGLEASWRTRLAGRGVELVATECSGRGPQRTCTVRIAAPEPLDGPAGRALAGELQAEIPGRPRVRLVTELAVASP